MSPSDLPPRAKLPPAAITALVITTILAFLSAMVLVPPFAMFLFPAAVGARELSPLLLILDLIWCVAAAWMLREHTVMRIASIGALVIGAVVCVVPLWQFRAAARSASEQVGNIDGPVRFSFLTAIKGLPSSSDLQVRSVRYFAADLTPLVMRIYSPHEHAARPTVVVIYGGAWRNGDATQCEDVSRALASNGYTVVAVDYRHAPAVHYPAPLDDIHIAFAMMRDSAQTWDIDLRRIALLGRSSGGHLAELAGFDPAAEPVRAVVALYAPYNLVEGYRDVPRPDPIDVRAVLRDFIGGPPETRVRQYYMASPSSWVKHENPPTLLMYGGRDHIIKPAFNREAAVALRAAGVPVVAVELPWAEHGFDMVTGLGGQLTFKTVLDFLNRELKHS